MSGKITVFFEPEGKEVTVEKGERILKVATRTGIGIRSECGGRALCGKCRVIVRDSIKKLSKITSKERKHLSAHELEMGYRLACQSRIMNSLTIFIPEESRVRKRRILVEGVERFVEIEPLVKKWHVVLSKPSLADARADAVRLLDALKERAGFDGLELNFDLIKELPRLLREANWDITVTIWKNREIISVEAGDTTSRIYGFAVDIGTSKIVGYLIDLLNGRKVAIQSIENPQVIHGEDVVSRLSYTMKGIKELGELQRLATDGINSIIREACKKTGVNPIDIHEVTVVGNTVMHHIFLGIEPRYISLAPYTPAIKGSLDVRAKDLGLLINPCGNVHILPVIAGFIGADNVGSILASGIHQTDELCLLLDIGTNTEVTLGNKEDMLSCSCASGPAFEGTHIKHGMKAVSGAIERVRIDGENFDVTYSTIEHRKPIGICGSAMIDALAEMLKHKILDRGGRFNEKIQTPRLRKVGNQLAFTIAIKKESAIGSDIVITQEDIRQIQLAKAAIYAACWITMKRKKVTSDDIDRIYLAGAFGNYINPKNAKLIGLVPDVTISKIAFIGNAAGSGAQMTLISKNMRDEADFISKKVRYLELAAEPDFQKEFTSATYFPHKDLSRFKSLRGWFKEG